MLLLLSFFFLFDQISSILSLKCLTNCAFQTFVGDDLPNLNTVTGPPTSCVIAEANPNPTGGADKTACTGDIKLEYPSNLLIFKLEGLKDGYLKGNKTSSPRRIARGKKMLIRGETKGSFHTENFTLRLFVVCATSDNCAWEILQQFYSDNTVAKAQIHGYKTIKDEFGDIATKNTSNLQCYENNNQPIQCPPGEERCTLSIYAYGQNVEHGCTKINPQKSNDFDFILTSHEDAAVDFQKTLSYSTDGGFLCSSNLCNSYQIYSQLLARITCLFTRSSDFFNPTAVTLQEKETTVPTVIKQASTSTRSTTSTQTQNPIRLHVPMHQSAASGTKRYVSPSVSIMIANFIIFKTFP